MTTISATFARTKLFDLLDEVEKIYKRFVITKNGRAIAVLVNPEELEAMEETMAVLNDKAALKAISKSREDIKKGKVCSFEEVTGEKL